MLDRRSVETTTTVLEQHFAVPFSFPVVFTRNAFDPRNRSLVEALAAREPDKRHRVSVFVDDGVLDDDLVAAIDGYAAAHAGSVELIGEIVRVPGGEAIKNDPQATDRLLDELIARRIDRHSYALAIGGGAVLDAVGFAAAIFHRGVRHVRMPTTVLAQDDSGVGVKNAVNHRGVKNLVGTFAPPWAVINDFAFIDALPDRERRAGLSEAVKVALIRDGAFFDWIEANATALFHGSPSETEHLIMRSAELHMRQIGQGGDPFETGSARPLDYGHWSAHKLERLSAHRLSHGEAVAIGIALDARYSVTSGLLPAGEEERICRVLAALGLPLWHETLEACDAGGEPALLAGLADFREHLGGELTVTLLAGIGRGQEVNLIASDLVREAIDWLDQRRAA